MPSHVMAFIEKLQASKGDISFFVQSGFPESSQSYYLEAYFELLAQRLGRTYLGTAIKGGVEGLQMGTPKAQERIIKLMITTIGNLINVGKFDSADIQQLAIPIRFGKGVGFIFMLLNKIGFINSMIWDPRIKANHAFEKRFDRPYVSMYSPKK
jgi:hypothetical protein